MYNVLIVDDEAPARELLKMRIDWDSINARVIGTARHGREALELYKKLQPDVLITDIQMPVMDGLELIEEVKAINPDQAIIILSCHENFSFAKKAIKLGVNDYLIKDSFQIEELYIILTDMFERLPKNQGYKLDLSPSDTNSEGQNIALRNIVHTDLNETQVRKYVSNYNLKLTASHYELMYLDVEIIGQDVIYRDTQFLEPSDIQLILATLRNTLELHALGEVFHDINNIFVVIYNTIDSHSEQEISHESIRIANQLRGSISLIGNTQTTIGISNPYYDLTLSHKAYEQARQASLRKVIGGYDKTYHHKTKNTVGESQYSKILNIKLARIKDSLESKQFDGIAGDLEDIYLQDLSGFMQYNYIKHVNWNLLSLFIDYCSKNSLSFLNICNTPSPWEYLMNLKSTKDMYEWLKQSVDQISNSLQPSAAKTYSYHIQNIVNYIGKNYRNNIRLTDLAKLSDLNEAYLSRLFKKETGQSVTDYINHVRIEEAKKLIENTGKKMYDIAELTGFSSTQRFFMVFKKIEGVSPGEYRKQT